MIRVVVSGSGKMGREILAALCREDDLEPVGVLGKFSEVGDFSLPDGSGRQVPITADLGLLRRLQPDVLVDFSHADWTSVVAPEAAEAGVRPVIGTSGIPEALVERLRITCQIAKLGAVIAPNFALGAVLLIHLARIVAPFFENVEVIELHHDQKVDAPSGTALVTAQEMLAARGGRAFTYPETSKENLAGTRGGVLGGVGLHSVRLPGLVAHQEVMFGGLGQTLSLRHDTTSRDSFLPGVLLAIREVMLCDELVVGLDRLLHLT